MVTLASGVATTSGRGCTADIDARTDGDGLRLADVECTVDVGPLSALRPRGGLQRVGVRVYMARGGHPFSRVMVEGTSRQLDDWLIGGWSVARSLASGGAQSASFTLSAQASPLGSAIATPAPIPGGYAIDVALAYRYGDDGEIELPLMQFGMADTTPRTDAGPITDSLSVVDSIQRNRQEKCTLQLPAGHGWTYAQVIRRLCQLMWRFPANQEMTSIPNIPGDFQFRKEVRLVNGDGFALANELADLWGMVIHANEWGQTTGVIYAPESSRGPILGVIDERDILRSVNGSVEPVTITPIPRAYTDICLQGTTQVTRPGASFRQSLSLPSKSFATFAPAVARYLDNGDGPGGTYTDTGMVPEVRDSVRSETLTVLDIDGETVVGIESGTRGFQNHNAARYTIDADLALSGIGGVYVEEQSDGAQAFAWPVERYMEQALSRTTRSFDDSNRLRREVTETEGWLHQRRAIQSRPDLNTAWENTASAPGLSGLVLGNGEGVVTDRPVWALLTRDTTEHEVSSDGYRLRRRKRVFGYGKEEGWEYRYGDGSESSDEQETFRLLSDEEEIWLRVPGREDIHAYQWLRRNRQGKVIEGKQELRQGFLEAADVRTDLAPAREDFESDADHALAQAASRYDTQPMAVELHDQSMLDRWRPIREPEQITVQYAQAPWQLLNLGRRLFLAGKVRAVTFSVPPNPQYRLGQWWRLRYRRPDMDIDHDGCIVESQFEQRGNDGPIVQTLTVAIN